MAEYGEPDDAAEAPDPGSLTLSFVPRLEDAQGRDRHKSLWWDARLDLADGHPSRLVIALHGRPRWFGLSLVQGYLVEPCLSLLAPADGAVLVPAAGIVRDGGVDLLIGRSRTGKSSLSVRALAAGLPVLGDDQVVVLANGTCLRFPRRLRVYDDLRRTAPRAAAQLPLRYRAGLVARRVARLATGGRVAPSLALPASALGTRATVAAPLRRVILLTRGAEVDRPTLVEATLDEALARVAEVLGEQRSRLSATIGPSLAPALTTCDQLEATVLRSAFGSASIMAVNVPASMEAGSAVTGLAQLLRLP